jgi:hypothetical protein
MQTKGTVWKVCRYSKTAFVKPRKHWMPLADEESSSGFFQSANTFLFGKKGILQLRYNT